MNEQTKTTDKVGFGKPHLSLWLMWAKKNYYHFLKSQDILGHGNYQKMERNWFMSGIYLTSNIQSSIAGWQDHWDAQVTSMPRCYSKVHRQGVILTRHFKLWIFPQKNLVPDAHIFLILKPLDLIQITNISNHWILKWQILFIYDILELLHHFQRLQL